MDKGKPIFYILDLQDKAVIHVHTESEHGYEGIIVYNDNRGENRSPIYIAKTFIENSKDRYDFTANEIHDFLLKGKTH